MQSNELIGIVTLDAEVQGVFGAISAKSFSSVATIISPFLFQAIRLQELNRFSLLGQTQASRHLKPHNSNLPDSAIVGKSEVIKLLKKDVSIVSPSDLSVLITGESGVG